jgi:hypothetical protein
MIEMNLNENFIDFISLLNKHDVKYVLVGGWAVIFEGYARTTGDMDFFIERSETNAEKLIVVLKKFCGSALGFNVSDFLKEDNILMIGRPPFRIDLLTSISGVDFDEAFNTSHLYKEDNFEVRCIHINELINNKKASGRLKDLADAEMLEKILKKRNAKK